MTFSRHSPVLFLFLLLANACANGSEPATSPAAASSAVPAEPATAVLPTATTPIEATETPVPGGQPTETSTASASATPPNGAPDAGGVADADVTFVRALQAADGTWTFHVTVSHPDTGWQDYADGWDIVTPGGDVIKREPSDPFTRLLLHPHVEEQPFTRSQSRLTVPDDVSQVTVRAHDLVDGFGGEKIVVDLTTTSGPGFEVERREE